MFIRETKKRNSSDGKTFCQYVLIQSYRVNGKPKQRNMVYLGSHKFLANKESRHKIAAALEDKIYNKTAFSSKGPPYHALSEEHRRLVDAWYEKYLEKEERDASEKKRRASLSKPANTDTANFEQVDTTSVETSQCREAGAEWLALTMAKQLKIDQFLEGKGFNPRETNMALLSMVARAVFPASERNTAQWLGESSALWEMFNTMEQPPNRFALYRMANILSDHFEAFIDQIYRNTMDMFALKDILLIYDLTNTYFEGRKLHSLLAQFGKSKEKRSDCKRMGLSAVVNKYGILKYAKVGEGNISETDTLLKMVKELKEKTHSQNLGKAIVMPACRQGRDAGITTEANLEVLRKNGEKYICVSRTMLKDYEQYLSEDMTLISDREGNKIEVKILDLDNKPDKWMLVKSDMKKKKEEPMADKLDEKFEAKLTNIAQGIHKKGGIKEINKVWERIGRARESSTRSQKKYDIEVGQKDGKAIEMTWGKHTDGNEKDGVYFIRTNTEDKSEKELWDICNTIREVESTFRCLKTDLRMRPIFHQMDKYSMAHIHLALMAYQIVAAIRHRLKENGINLDWTSIVQIMNTQKMNTIEMKLKTKELHIRKMSIPNEQVEKIYEVMGIKEFPNPTKTVVYH